MANDIQYIEKVFNREKRPYWKLYTAKGELRATTPPDVLEIADKEKRLEESWTKFSEAVEDEGDGNYKVILRTSENAGKNELKHSFTYGDVVVEEKTETRRHTNTSIGGLGSISGLEFIMGVMTRADSEKERLRDENQTLKMDLLRKEFKIGQLESEVNAPKGDDSLGTLAKDILRDYFPDILDRFAPAAPTRVAAYHIDENDIDDEDEDNIDDEDEDDIDDEPKPPRRPLPKSKNDKNQEPRVDGEAVGDQEAAKAEAAKRIGNVLKWIAATFKGYAVPDVLEIIQEMASKDPSLVIGLKFKLKEKHGR